MNRIYQTQTWIDWLAKPPETIKKQSIQEYSDACHFLFSISLITSRNS